MLMNTKLYNGFLICFFLFYDNSLFSQTLSWSTLIDTATTFSSPRLVNLNNDGVDDIVIGGGVDGSAQTNGVLAIDGLTGAVLWSFAVNEEIFTSAQFQDINGDNVDDVFIGGRYAEFYAIDGATGTMIWEFFPHPPTSSVDSGWFNFYTPQWIPDQNSDGFQDLLMANGGNHTLPPWDTLRDPGYLMVVDALTGAVLAMDTMPDGEETYCSPVVADLMQNGNLEIIYGSGGENDRGALWRVSLADLMSNDISGSTQLASSSTRGFIAPPSLVDINGDSYLDIVAQGYDGTVHAISGFNNLPLWSTGIDWTTTESSVNPIIGNFTGDITPDVFTVIAKGEAPSFFDFYQVLIDGKTGEIVWKDSIAQLHFCAANAVDMNMDGRDEVIVSVNYNQGAGFKHQLMTFDFENNTTTALSPQQGGVNLGSTPTIADMDNDGLLEIVYAFRADSTNPMGQNGFKVNKLETNYTIPGVGIAWGSYMGTDFDGQYNYLGTPCGTISPNLTLTNITCNDSADASIVVNPVDGVAPYTFLWSTGAITDSIGGLDVGAYSVRITDSTGCYVDSYATTSDPFIITFGGLIAPNLPW